MSSHNYRLEPNVSFTPDQKWVVFRSNMFGDTYVIAAEVDKTEKNRTREQETTPAAQTQKPRPKLSALASQPVREWHS